MDLLSLFVHTISCNITKWKVKCLCKVYIKVIVCAVIYKSCHGKKWELLWSQAAMPGFSTSLTRNG